jgi:hypothetical protein
MLFIYIFLYLVAAYAVFLIILFALAKMLFPKQEENDEKVQGERARRVHLSKRLSYRMAGRNGRLAY